MKTFAAAIIAAVGQAAMLNENDFKFAQHVAEFNLNFETVEEYNFRFQVFMQFDAAIEEIMATPGITSTHGHNEFSTWTEAEWARMNGYIPESEDIYDSIHEAQPDEIVENGINWVQKGYVTSVKNQGGCGSCWAFAATACMEALWMKKQGQLIDLSEQELVSCDYYQSGCNGGNYGGAWKWISVHKQNKLSAYPYTSGSTKQTGTCDTSKEYKGATCNGKVAVTKNSDSALVSALNGQPVGVSVAASSKYFGSYKTGTMTDFKSCGSDIDHAITAVGYTSSYYLVKNSWGTSWGLSGYG